MHTEMPVKTQEQKSGYENMSLHTPISVAKLRELAGDNPDLQKSAEDAVQSAFNYAQAIKRFSDLKTAEDPDPDDLRLAENEVVTTSQVLRDLSNHLPKGFKKAGMGHVGLEQWGKDPTHSFNFAFAAVAEETKRMERVMSN